MLDQRVTFKDVLLRLARGWYGARDSFVFEPKATLRIKKKRQGEKESSL